VPLSRLPIFEQASFAIGLGAAGSPIELAIFRLVSLITGILMTVIVMIVLALVMIVIVIVALVMIVIVIVMIVRVGVFDPVKMHVYV
jgi:hypothetical protein